MTEQQGAKLEELAVGQRVRMHMRWSSGEEKVVTGEIISIDRAMIKMKNDPPHHGCSVWDYCSYSPHATRTWTILKSGPVEVGDTVRVTDTIEGVVAATNERGMEIRFACNRAVWRDFDLDMDTDGFTRTIEVTEKAPLPEPEPLIEGDVLLYTSRSEKLPPYVMRRNADGGWDSAHCKNDFRSDHRALIAATDGRAKFLVRNGKPVES